MNTAQLSIFDRPPPLEPATPATKASTTVEGEIFALGDRIQITQIGPPLEYLNGQKGEIIHLRPGLASVKVEGIATAIVLRVEALERWTSISEFTAVREEAESIGIFCLGDRVECEGAYLGRVGAVRRIGVRCGVMVAWVNYGEGVPPYPCSVERLLLAE
jgi:hypothetical protein